MYVHVLILTTIFTSDLDAKLRLEKDIFTTPLSLDDLTIKTA